jgi:hypothetical protein
MKITLNFLIQKHACHEAIIEFKKHGDCELIALLEKMIKGKKHLDWGNWLIVRCMGEKQYISYAIYAAEQVLGLFEKKYPDDNRPQKAIEAAVKYIKNSNIKNKNAANAAADAAADAAYAAANAAANAAYAANAATYAAADAAYAAYAAAYAVANAAANAATYAAADAAYAAANAANAATYAAAYAAADAAADAAARTKMQIKILKYGIILLKRDLDKKY